MSIFENQGKFFVLTTPIIGLSDMLYLYTLKDNVLEVGTLTKYFRDIFEKVNSYKIFQRHDPCMGWYCPGGMRKEGDVLKCLGKKNQETRRKKTGNQKARKGMY